MVIQLFGRTGNYNGWLGEFYAPTLRKVREGWGTRAFLADDEPFC
jgi:hypothetical protein